MKNKTKVVLIFGATLFMPLTKTLAYPNINEENPILKSTQGVIMVGGVFYPNIGVVAMEDTPAAYDPRTEDINRITGLLEGGLSWWDLSEQEKTLITEANPTLAVYSGGAEALNLVPIEKQTPELTEGYVLYMDSWYEVTSPFSPDSPDILITPDNAQEWAAITHYLRTPNCQVNLVFKTLLPAGKALSQIDWTAIDIEGWDISNMDFSKCNLTGDQITKAIGFKGTNLSGVTMEGFSAATRDLSRINLSGSTIKGHQLSGATSLEEANLSGCDLEGFDPIGASLEKANLSNSTNLLPERLVRAKSLRGAVLTGSGITYDSLARELIKDGKNPSSPEYSGITF